MGINGFYSFFDEANCQKYISELKGSIVIVDLSGILIRYGIGIRSQGEDKKNKDGKVINHLYAIVKYSISLLEKGILPFYVFDGKVSDSKKIILSERRQNKIASETKCESINDKTSEEYIKYFKRTYTFYRSDVEECKEILNLMGIPFIHAPGEADSQCAVLAYMFSNKISGVITDDSDILVYGCPTIYRDFNPKEPTMKEVSHMSVLNIFNEKINKILTDLGKPRKVFNYEYLKTKVREFCILMGSDYGKPIMTKGNSKKTDDLLVKFVENDLDVMKLITAIKLNGIATGRHQFYVSATIIEDFQQANSEYIDSKALIPQESDICMSRPDHINLAIFLRRVMNYTDKDIEEINNIALDKYRVFNEMAKLKDNNLGCEHFSSFQTYRYKHCSKYTTDCKKMKHPHQAVVC